MRSSSVIGAWGRILVLVLLGGSVGCGGARQATLSDDMPPRRAPVEALELHREALSALVADPLAPTVGDALTTARDLLDEAERLARDGRTDVGLQGLAVEAVAGQLRLVASWYAHQRARLRAGLAPPEGTP